MKYVFYHPSKSNSQDGFSSPHNKYSSHFVSAHQTPHISNVIEKWPWWCHGKKQDSCRPPSMVVVNVVCCGGTSWKIFILFLYQNKNYRKPTTKQEFNPRGLYKFESLLPRDEKVLNKQNKMHKTWRITGNWWNSEDRNKNN